uniref:Flavin-containing monooxygenase n=1 Tax=Panagrolaimus sp. PS1159 TaxID=55785 RepID=A0AC35F690_9BILA
MSTKNICIIGAGAAGLCAAKRCISAGYNVKIYEQCSILGGTWVYNESIGIHSSMYEKMHTNLPKEVMRFEDYPFPESEQSFIEHFTVLKYLNNYASTIKDKIQFDTKVLKVERSSDNTVWNVTTEKNEQSNYAKFDVVFVCNGHFFHPRIPNWATNLRVPTIHSHDYRKAQNYKDKIIAIIGAGASGTDIGIQIGKYAKKVYLCHHNYKSTQIQLPKTLKIVPGVKDANKDSLILTDGTILQDIEAVILCTGYRYSYPFFDKALIQTPEDDSYVSPLFAHVAHVHYPDSLFFIGLNLVVVPFILFDYQVGLALALIAGKAKNITTNEIKEWEPKRLKMLANNGIDVKRYHVLADKQWEYFQELCKYSGDVYKTPEVVRKIYDEVSEGRKTAVTEYKKHIYKIVDSKIFIKHNSTNLEYD